MHESSCAADAVRFRVRAAVLTPRRTGRRYCQQR
ncbi:MAG: hypothetical protein QOF36_251 [Microbacteriaceae bacterium]|nr:hypothetical protein [Microbacteriaceae bacterium]